MTKTLEEKTNISEKDIEKARKDFERLSLIAHFGGEITGCALFLKGIIDAFMDKYNLSIVEFGSGVALWLVPQIPAFFLKGLSMSEQMNYDLAKKFAYDYKKNRKENNPFRQVEAWADKQLCKLHLYFAKNHEKYEKLTETYINLKRKLSFSKAI